MKGLPLPFLAVFAAAVSAAIGGSAVVATRLAVPESNPLTVTFLRFLGASVVMLAFTLPRTRVRIDWRDLPPVAGLALIQFALFAWFFSASLQYIPAARGALVLSTQPLLTLALAALLRRERFTLAKAAGGVIALAGVAFALGDRVSVPGSDTARGDRRGRQQRCRPGDRHRRLPDQERFGHREEDRQEAWRRSLAQPDRVRVELPEAGRRRAAQGDLAEPQADDQLHHGGAGFPGVHGGAGRRRRPGSEQARAVGVRLRLESDRED